MPRRHLPTPPESNKRRRNAPVEDEYEYESEDDDDDEYEDEDKSEDDNDDEYEDDDAYKIVAPKAKKPRISKSIPLNLSVGDLILTLPR